MPPEAAWMEVWKKVIFRYELMFDQAQLAEHVQLADKGWKFERRLLLNNELMSAETDKGCEYDII